MLHIYPLCGIFNFLSIDTGTRDHQFNVSSKQHPARILLMKVYGKKWVLSLGIQDLQSKGTKKYNITFGTEQVHSFDKQVRHLRYADHCI